MDTLTKTIIFWLFWTAILWLIAQIQYKFYDGALRKKYFMEDNWCWTISIGSLVTGCIILGGYLFLSLASWWFKL